MRQSLCTTLFSPSKAAPTTTPPSFITLSASAVKIPPEDDEKRISPVMLPWDELDIQVQKHDIKQVEGLPGLLNECGFKIVLSKVSLLAEVFLAFVNVNDFISVF